MIPPEFLKQLPAFYAWCDRILAKCISQEEKENARNPSKSQATEMVSLPTLCEQTASLPSQTECDLVSLLRCVTQRRLEEENSKGGNQWEEMNEKPTLEMVVVELVKLKRQCLKNVEDVTYAIKIESDIIAQGVGMGYRSAYEDISQRLDQLIVSIHDHSSTGG